MSAVELLVLLTYLGIRLESHGDRLRYWPRSAVTPVLLRQMREHKAELLAMLRPHAQRVQPAWSIVLSAASTVNGNTLKPEENSNTVDVDSVDGIRMTVYVSPVGY